MKIYKKTISEALIDTVFLTSIAFFPTYLFSNTEWQVLQVIRFAIQSITILFLLRYLFKKGKMIDYVIIAYFSVPVFSTIINGNNDQIASSLMTFVAGTSTVCYFKHRLASSQKSFLRNAIIIWGTLICLNTLTLMIFSKQQSMYGRTGFYLLGNDNATIFEAFTFIIYLASYSILYKNRIPLSSYIVVLYILCGYVIAWSGNAMAISLLLLATLAVVKSKTVQKIINRKRILIAFVLFFLTFIVFRSETSISGRILTFMGKDTTYTGRTVIWDKMTPHIKNNIILGNGNESLELSRAKYGHMKAHNLFYQALYTGGLVQLFLLLSILSIAFFNKKPSKNKTLTLLVDLTFLLFLIMNSFDYDITRYTLIYYPLIVYYCIPNNKIAGIIEADENTISA